MPLLLALGGSDTDRSHLINPQHKGDLVHEGL